VTKSVLFLVAAGTFAWAAGRAPGLPTAPEEFRVVQISHQGRLLGREPLRVRARDRVPTVHVDVAGCERNGGASVRAWVVEASGTAPMARQSAGFTGTSGSVPCGLTLPGAACRVVLCAEDQRGRRETRSFAVEPILR